MRPITDIKERQSIALAVLLHFRDFCNANNIKYMLAYGTLLGAIRHKGFIPWDDDVDVMMTRYEYNKFIKLYNNNKQGRYKLLSMHTNKKYFAPLAKMYDDKTLLVQEYGQQEKIKYGIYIDIFIIDSIPNGDIEAAEFYNRAETWRFYWAMSVKKINSPSSSWHTKILRIPVIFLTHVIGYKYFLKKYDEHSSKYYNSHTDYAGIVIYGEGLAKEKMHWSLFQDLTNVVFENDFFLAPHNCESYLTQMYGDYLKLPKKEDRKIHPSKAYWK